MDGEQWFAFRADMQSPLTQEGREAVAGGVDLAEAMVRGFMVVSQTCNVCRKCAERPYVEVCPLVKVDDSILREVEKLRRPRYAFAPGLREQSLVADLDRVMTVEKGVVAQWNRTPGPSSEPDARNLARALARKRERFAFPDDFCNFVKPLVKRLRGKHSKNSEEGRALQALDEIRVLASPSWSTTSVELTFLFIPQGEQVAFEQREWAYFLEKWLGIVPDDGRFTTLGIVQTLSEMSAKDYMESARLDLDSLSHKT